MRVCTHAEDNQESLHQKPDGGVRGIATGTSFPRLVARTLARQFGKAVEATCAPFQFALSTRASTDCVGHAIRAVADANPVCTVLSIDGIGAYDHVYRSAMLAKLHEVPSLQGLLPFVRATHATPTSYVWEDEAGVQHRIIQAEQGDPLMPLLFSLAIHDPLQQAQREFRADENLFAFLDERVTASDRSCMLTQASNFTQGRRACGIGRPCARRGSDWDPRSGTQKA